MKAERYILETPAKFFTKDFENFLTALELTVAVPTSPFLEDECILAYVRSGKGEIIVNGISFSLKPGCLCQLHSYHVFQIYPDDNLPLDMIFLTEDYTLMSYWSFFQNKDEAEAKNIFYLPPVIYPKREMQQTIFQIFQSIMAEDLTEKKHSLFMKSVLYTRLHYLYQYICLNHPKNCASYSPTPVWNILIYLTVYGCTDPSLEKVSAQFGLPPAVINRKIKEITHLSFSQFLARAKVNYSSAALMLEHLSLHSIAVNAGFSSESTFFRQFSRYRGCTPQEYRRQIAAVKFQNPDVLVSDDAYEILYYITCHFNDVITLKKLCNELYITEQNAASILQKKFQISFHEMVTIFRLRYAQALLLVSPMTLVDISACCGFQSVHTFIRLFRAKNHLTPTAYRKKYKERIYES